MIVPVRVLGRLLGHAMSETFDPNTFAKTFYAFRPAAGVNLPELCDLVIDYDDGWVLPIRGEGGGEISQDLVSLLYGVPRIREV